MPALLLWIQRPRLRAPAAAHRDPHGATPPATLDRCRPRPLRRAERRSRRHGAHAGADDAREVGRVRRSDRAALGRITAGDCGRSRCRTSRRSSATSASGRPTSSRNGPMVEVGWRLARRALGPRLRHRGGEARRCASGSRRSISTRSCRSRCRRTRDRAGHGAHRPRARSGRRLRPPRVDPVAYPHLVRHVFYRLPHSDWVG